MKNPLRRHATALMVILAISTASLSANSEMRTWRPLTGGPFEAEIVSVDEPNKKVLFRTPKGEEKPMTFDDFSVRDKAWLIEWIETNEELADKVRELGGRFERIDDQEGKGRSGFYVYHPSGAVDAATPRPLMFMFDPSGNPTRYILRHIEASDKCKITLVCSEAFRNGGNTDDASKKFDLIHTLVQSAVPHDKNRFFYGGTSGGALSAFATSANLPHIKIAGVYSNGGWLGRNKDSERPYPAVRVAMVNGDKDDGASAYLKSVTRILQERKCTVSLFSFEGGHQIPPASVQIKSFRWLLGEFD